MGQTLEKQIPQILPKNAKILSSRNCLRIFQCLFVREKNKEEFRGLNKYLEVMRNKWVHTSYYWRGVVTSVQSCSARDKGTLVRTGWSDNDLIKECKNKSVFITSLTLNCKWIERHTYGKHGLRNVLMTPFAPCICAKNWRSFTLGPNFVNFTEKQRTTRGRSYWRKKSRLDQKILYKKVTVTDYPAIQPTL